MSIFKIFEDRGGRADLCSSKSKRSATKDKAPYLKDPNWIEDLGDVVGIAREEWGVLTSLRVTLASGLELELGLADSSWASVDPIDAGTERVVRDGAKILHDPRGLPSRLVHTVTTN